MSSVDNLIEQLASTKVEDGQKKEVSFCGQALQLDTEEDAADLVKAIENCPGMKTLHLEGNTVGVPAAKVIGKALETQSDFENALWKDMFTRRDKTEIPQALSYLSDGIMIANAKLVVLDLSDNAFGPRGLVGIQKLLSSPSCYTLKELILNNNGLGISGAQLLSEAVCSCIENSRKNGTPLQLRVFVCGRNRLENPGAISVSKFLKQLGTLESVSMPQNGIYHPGIKELADAFSCNQNLKSLNLEDNSLTEQGAEYIAGCLPSLKSLESLNLGDCLVRTTGALALANAIKDNCPLLKNINLGFNEIGYAGAEAITDAMEHKEHLEMLEMNGNNFGEEGCYIAYDKMEQFGKIDCFGSLSQDEGDDEDNDDEDEHSESEEEQVSDDDDEATPTKQTTHKSPMCKLEPADFIANPTAETLLYLYNSKEEFAPLLPAEPTIADYVDLFLKVSLVVQPNNKELKEAASYYADNLLSKAYALSKTHSEFNDSFLVGIGLLKGEEKKVKNLDITGTLIVLEHVVKQSYCHKSTRELLQFFLSRPLPYITASSTAKHQLLQTLYQI